MKHLVISLIFTLGFGTAFAGNTQTYDCKHSSPSVPNRKVEVNYLSEAKKVPCDVVYSNGGISKTIYHANNEVGFCEKSTQTFLEKLKGEGWTCEEAGTASKPVETQHAAPAQHATPAEHSAPASQQDAAPAAPASDEAPSSEPIK